MLFLGFYHKQALTNAAVQKKRVELFNKEAKRQATFITDVEKITVKYCDQPEECTLVMNKNISTPYNCAQRKYTKCRLLSVLFFNVGVLSYEKKEKFGRCLKMLKQVHI